MGSAPSDIRTSAMCPARDDAPDGAACSDGELGWAGTGDSSVGGSSPLVNSSTPSPATCFFLLRGALGEGGPDVWELPDVADGGADVCSGGGSSGPGGVGTVVSSPFIAERVRRSPATLGRSTCIIVLMFWLCVFSDGGEVVLFCGARPDFAGSFEPDARAIYSDTFYRRRETKAGLPPPAFTGAASRGLARRVAALEGWSTDPWRRASHGLSHGSLQLADTVVEGGQSAETGAPTRDWLRRRPHLKLRASDSIHCEPAELSTNASARLLTRSRRRPPRGTWSWRRRSRQHALWPCGSRSTTCSPRCIARRPWSMARRPDDSATRTWQGGHGRPKGLELSRRHHRQTQRRAQRVHTPNVKQAPVQHRSDRKAAGSCMHLQAAPSAQSAM